ncbi:MAG TPA: acyltransferase [Labilithrix sp.]|nr:acyltransferase [Labilithrix sp.]
MSSAELVRRFIGSWVASRKLRSCDVIGRGSRVLGTPYVENLGRIEIGMDFEIDALPVASHLVTGVKGTIRIGDRVKVAHGVAMCSHVSIDIGDDTSFGPFAIVLDADFHGVRARGAPADPRPVRIGRHVHIGAGTIVLRGAVIGDDVTVAPNSVVSRWIPSGVRVAGVPAKLVRGLELVRR